MAIRTYHMHHSVFTIIDANHHTEDWTFMMKDKPIHAHFDLHARTDTEPRGILEGPYGTGKANGP